MKLYNKISNTRLKFSRISIQIVMLAFFMLLFFSNSEAKPLISITIHIDLGVRDSSGICQYQNKLRLCNIWIDVSWLRTLRADATYDGENITLNFLDELPVKDEAFEIADDFELSSDVNAAFNSNKPIILQKGNYPVRYEGTPYGSVTIPVGVASLNSAINCGLIQDGHFENVTVSGSNITNTSTPWKPGVNTPQWGSTNDCDGRGGYAQFWGNQVVGESIIQTLGFGGIMKGQRYNLSFCAKLMATQNSLNPNHVRIRVIAYNGTAPNRATLPTANATLIYETPTITSTTWQTFNSCSWIADKNYTNIEVLPVNNSTLNDGNFVSWGHVDNMQLCQVDPCEGLNLKIYPDQTIQGKCCFKVDLNLQSCFTNLKGVRIKTPAGVTIASASAPTSWTQSGLTANTVVWNKPLNAFGTYSGGTLCLNAPNTSPFFVMIEWVDNNDSVFCRTERKLQCPPPCLEIESLKSITCIGYDQNGYPQYNFCLNLVNNSTPQTISLISPSGTFSPSSYLLGSGASTICGVFTANSITPPASINITSGTADGTCLDSVAVKIPNDCPPKECMKIEETRLECLATNQQGGSTYQFSYVITNLSGVLPNTVTVSSNGGPEFIIPNVPLNTPTNLSGVIQYATPINGLICLTFTIRNANGAIICSERVCIQAPVCQDCCTGFDKGVKINSVTRTGINSNGDNISMNITFAPNRPIKTMSATIVSASRRKVAPVIGAWERIYGDIGGASAIPMPTGPGLRYYGGIAPSTSFAVPTLKTREVEWGTNYAGTTGSFNTTIGLLFPAPLTGSWTNPTTDELDYYLRISMTDVKCITCDTLIHITLKRKSSPWIAVDAASGNVIKRKIDGKKYEEIQSSLLEAGSAIQLKMNSKDKGVLTLKLPVDKDIPAEEKITIVGIGFIPEEIIDIEDFSPISSNFKKEVNDEYLYCSGKLTEGESASFNVGFINPPFDKWNNTVVIKYMIGTEQETMTDFVNVVASIPVEQVGGDKFEELVDASLQPRTYSLSFINSNKSNRAIAYIELRLPKNVKLLAYGSGLSDSLLLETRSVFNNEDVKIASYLIPVENGNNPNTTIKFKEVLNPGESVKPIYITVIGGDSAIDIGFTTKDEDGTVLSEGVVRPTVPMSIDTEDEIGATSGATMMLDVYPNPASNSTTINLGLLNSEVVGIIVTDMQGKEVATVLNERQLNNGDNVFILNTGYLNSGSYTVTAKTKNGKIVSTKLQIIK